MFSKEFKSLFDFDPYVASEIENELHRQQYTIELIASENIVSKNVLTAMGSILTNKYAEGYPNKRYYGGCQYIDNIETTCIERAKKLFNCNYANVQPHSGSQANFAVYQALCKPGDTILSMNLSNGGHLTHGSTVNFSGKLYNFIFYGVNSTTGLIDYDEIRKLAEQHKPKLIVAGASAYPRKIDFKQFAVIAQTIGAYLMVDMAHIAGLVAVGVHDSPIKYADVVTSTTHKTLRGPRGGLILTNSSDIAKKINSSVFPGTQGGPLEHIIAAKAVCFKEALQPEFKTYQQQVVKNARALANSLMYNDIDLVSNGTDNHLILIDLRKTEYCGKAIESLLDSVNITVNKNSIPNDKLPVTKTSGIRIGTPAITTRGFEEEDCEQVGYLISLIIKDFYNNQDYVKQEVRKLCDKYPIYS